MRTTRVVVPEIGICSKIVNASGRDFPFGVLFYFFRPPSAQNILGIYPLIYGRGKFERARDFSSGLTAGGVGRGDETMSAREKKNRRGEARREYNNSIKKKKNYQHIIKN